MAPWRPGQHPVGALRLPRVRWQAAAVLFIASGCGHPAGTGSPHEFLARAWEAYKDIYIHRDGYVVDPDRNGGETTSEGQGYAMLRAMWMRDEATFTTVFRWTERHLRRPDGLYSWRWSPDGGGKLLDSNSAADADQEIALALVLGSEVFGNPQFLTSARELLRAIRTHEAVGVRERWFPAAGNWALSDRIVNLSYFLPYAYPYFARVDNDGGWDQVIDVGYDLIARTLKIPDTHLVPDFTSLTASGAPERLREGAGLSGSFSSDAMRIYWRVAADCRLHKRARACGDPLGANTLTGMLDRDGALFTRYAVNTQPMERIESMSFYGIALPYLLIHTPATGSTVRAKHLSEATLRLLLTERHRYFDANWVWFGMALTEGVIAERTPSLHAFPVHPRPGA